MYRNFVIACSIVLASAFSPVFASFKNEASEQKSAPAAVPRSLVFLDHKEPKDNISFLSSKFPMLVEACNGMPGKENDYEDDMDSTLRGEGTPKERYLKSVGDHFGVTIYNPLLFRGNQDDARRQAQFESEQVKQYMAKLKPGMIAELFLCRQQLNQNRTIGEDLVIAARRIDGIVNRNGKAPVLFLGRTPCFIQLALEEIYNPQNTYNVSPGQILHLSFSGCPDEITIRESSSYKDADANCVRDMVTPEKLNYYEAYMTRMGMDKVGDKLYLVDMFSTGTGLNSFLRILRHYYQDFLNRDMPDVYFISLSTTLNSDHGYGPWRFTQNTGKLIFKSEPIRGVRPCIIKLIPLQVSHSTMRTLLDNDYIQAFAMHGIEFPAQKWREEFTEQLNAGGKWHREIYPTIRGILSNIISRQEHQLIQDVDAFIKSVD